MRRSISAPTIAACWSPRRRGPASFASSTPFRGSSGWARGSAATGRLRDAAMDRAVEALHVCAGKLDRRGRSRAHRLIATEACRSAENGAEFLERVRDGDRPGAGDRRPRDRGAAGRRRLLLAGRARHATACVLFDIGGGSSELALIDLPRRRPPRRLSPTTSSPGRRCRSASSRSPSASAAATSRRQSFEAMVDHVARDARPTSKGATDWRDRCRDRRLPPARHVRHGDHARRHPSRPAALRPPPRRRHLADRRRGRRR